MIVDRQGSDAGVGRCGAADSPAQMGSESEYLQCRTVSGAPRDIRYARQLLHDRSAQVRAELADLGVSVADYELLLIVSLEPRGVVL